MRKFLISLPLVAGLLMGMLAAAIAFGGPGEPPPMLSITDPFKGIDFSGLPATRRFVARDGTRLAYRAYAPQGLARGSVVLVHGSSASSVSMHVLARALAESGLAAYALDMRGHGESGTKGRIDHVGQLDDDIEDFMRSVQPARPATLAGLSAGGGFALRVAAGERQTLFDQYLLLAPFISQDAPTYRADSGGWVSVGIPRIVALSLLDAVGVQAFGSLPVTRFALNEQAKAMLTPTYGYALATNFRPRADWRGSIRSARQPMRLLAGEQDEAFHAERYAALFQGEGSEVPVTLLPGVTHVGLILQPRAVQAIVSAVAELQSLQAVAQR
jgi:alpha-beta hydrolase superfamily lysophospholipase